MDKQYNQRLAKIEEVLQAWLPENPNLDNKNWIERVFSRLPEAASELPQSLTLPSRDLLDRGGKRWRPLLMTLLCESLGGKDQALPLTPLVEFPHNASLIHDDIEDGSDKRRGEPAIHIRYGTDTAINSGAFLYFLSLACIEAWDASPERKTEAFSLWARYIRRLHLGQAMDIAWHRDFASFPSIEAYNRMCRLKTGSLAALAAALGALAAGAAGTCGNEKSRSDTTETAGAAEKTGTFGFIEKAGIIEKIEKIEKTEKTGARINNFIESAEKLGMGFQILDDVKNLTEGNPGKQRGDDVVEGKKSLPVLLYAKGQDQRKAFLGHCFSGARKGGVEAPEVERLIRELAGAGAITEAENAGRRYIAEARDFFACQIGGKLLAGLAAFIGGGSDAPRSGNV
ncbi:MAG: polyprenyl synthetase family protein [Spirochaetaceae bacterium]|jgi:octaprenyl-diphosphate synthase|nr:polyprenyl synthetase family protein [Spirochaetaceae bacterium]